MDYTTHHLNVFQGTGEEKFPEGQPDRSLHVTPKVAIDQPTGSR